MNIRNWLNDSYQRISEQGVEGAIESLRPVKLKFLSTGNLVRPRGTSIYDREWDLLVVLDACRYDLFTELANSYEWSSDVSEIRSLDSTTAFWMRRTFNQDRYSEMSETAYICGNPFSKEELHRQDFAKLHEIWESAWTDPGTVPPEAITDETIRLMRNESHDRVIAHYMQPHCPFIPKPELSRGKDLDKFGNQDWKDVWERLRDGDISHDELWEGYRENLQLVMNEVDSLLQNVNAGRVVITSDHGNAKGEWGVYGHPPNQPMDVLRRVPWVETTAEDSGERKPEDWRNRTMDVDRQEQLSSLGYV